MTHRHLFFTYGTLRQGFPRNPAVGAFHDGATFLSQAHLPGRLYNIGWYPGLVESSEEPMSLVAADGRMEIISRRAPHQGRGDPARMVVGDLWGFDDDRLVDLLDAYEDILGPGPAEYARLRRRVLTPQGPAKAWVYIYIADVEGRELIATGDWRDGARDPQPARPELYREILRDHLDAA